MAPKIERLLKGFTLGGGPHWDAASQSLYLVDVFPKQVHKYVPGTKKHTMVTIPGDKSVSFIIPVEGHKDKFVTTHGREILIITWDGESGTVSSMETIVEVDTAPETQKNMLNDGKCDSSGRLWTGTIGEIDRKTLQMIFQSGNLYSIRRNTDVKKRVSGIGISNGLTWNHGSTKFYYIDSSKGTVQEYAFDAKSGTISNPKVVFTLNKSSITEQLLGGMTIDTDGNLWIAVFNSYSIIKIDPRYPGTVLETIKLPAKQTTSLTFGGPNLDELYVTTGSHTFNNDVLRGPDHGALYRVTGTGSKGYPGTMYKM